VTSLFVLPCRRRRGEDLTGEQADREQQRHRERGRT
jgi:hypothetical protein